MDATLVFVRTALAHEPAMLRMLGLSPSQRWLLELIDGRRNVAQLAVTCPALSRSDSDLDQLVRFGLIDPLQTPKPAAPPVQRSVVSKPPRDDEHLIARLLATKPAIQDRLTRAAFEIAPPRNGRRG